MQGERLDIQIPQDDGSIAQALAELDTKVSAWTEAMHAAESHLAELAETCRRQMEAAKSCLADQPVSDPIDSEPEIAVDQEIAVDEESLVSSDEPLESSTDTEVTAEVELASDEQFSASTQISPAELPEASPEPQVIDDSEPEPVQIEDVATESVAEEPEIVPEVTAESQDDVESQTAADTDQHADGQEKEDDEALLASLDPEAAKAIRVMRRLAPGHISVRELLAEYEATKKHEHVEEPQKKSWFRSRR